MNIVLKSVISSVVLPSVLLLAGTVRAETIFRKTFSYFAISGKTPAELDDELAKRGPMARATGARHPGATQIKFGGSVTYYESGGRCAVKDAKVTLSTKIILPKWSNRRNASKEMRLIWDTLASDIKRHEERHAEIARTHARKLERDLQKLGTASNCNTMKDRVSRVSEESVAAHDADQRRFDRIEAANFENRMFRLLRYRLEARK